MLTMLERIVTVLHRARVNGGWDDEDVARKVLNELGLDENGDQAMLEYTSSGIGHG